MSLYATVPFISMLFSIALIPIYFEKFWSKNINKFLLSIFLGLPVLLILYFSNQLIVLANTILYDYLPFMILLGSLFVVTGNIFIEGDIEANPANNSIILAAGTIAASFLGTMGASILLIRPLIRSNKVRSFKVHTILFFIAIVANSGGLLTPLGDPPLFLLYLKGVPFFWFLKLFLPWLFINGLLILIYFFVDKHFWHKEINDIKFQNYQKVKSIKFYGLVNLVWLSGIILAIAFVNPQFFPSIDTFRQLRFLRETIILLMAIMSYVTTNKNIRLSNQFNWHPIIDVACVFLGIFITMVPCIIFLEKNAQLLVMNSPFFFYFATGCLSSFLDNAPTAIIMFTYSKNISEISQVLVVGIPEIILKAISMGAVIFGSMTYIGNGPNFMIKSIAEHQGIEMPHFFQYIIRFSIIVLLPVYVLAYIIFF